MYLVELKLPLVFLFFLVITSFLGLVLFDGKPIQLLGYELRAALKEVQISCPSNALSSCLDVFIIAMNEWFSCPERVPNHVT